MSSSSASSSVEFCGVCRNMYYHRVSKHDTNQLVFYCRFCGVEKEITTENNFAVCVLETDFKETKPNFEYIMNPYIKLDPTLPRLYNMKCPNEQCASHETPDIFPEILYKRYDVENLKHLYICKTCDTNWKT